MGRADHRHQRSLPNVHHTRAPFLQLNLSVLSLIPPRLRRSCRATRTQRRNHLWIHMPASDYLARHNMLHRHYQPNHPPRRRHHPYRKGSHRSRRRRHHHHSHHLPVYMRRWDTQLVRDSLHLRLRCNTRLLPLPRVLPHDHRHSISRYRHLHKAIILSIIKAMDVEDARRPWQRCTIARGRGRTLGFSRDTPFLHSCR